MWKTRRVFVDIVLERSVARRPKQKLHVAVIGAGRIAQGEHLPAWRRFPDASVVAIADPSLEALETVGREFSIESRVDDYRELLDDPQIDVIDVCAPSALHAAMTIAALEAGKHVLCEKPMATSACDAAAVLDAQRRCDGKLMIAQHLRFHPATLGLRSSLERYPLGEVYYARAQWLRRRRLPASPAFTRKALSGGGALYDLGVHMLDLTWWLMGCPKPALVSGATFDRLSRSSDVGGEWGTWDPNRVEVEDFAAGWVRFENGAVLALETSWLGFQAEQDCWHVRLYGDKAGATWPEARVFGETNRRPWEQRSTVPRGPKAHHAVLHAFAKAVVCNTSVPVPTGQSATVIAMLEALYRSAAEGLEVAVETLD